MSNLGLTSPLANSSGFSYFGETLTTTIAPAIHSRRWLCMWFEYAMMSPYLFFLAFQWAVMNEGKLELLKKNEIDRPDGAGRIDFGVFLGRQGLRLNCGPNRWIGVGRVD